MRREEALAEQRVEKQGLCFSRSAPSGADAETRHPRNNQILALFLYLPRAI
jgi:hypothetical protein